MQQSPVEAVPDKTRRKEAGVIDNAVDKAAEGFEETVVENAAVLKRLEKNGAFAKFFI